LARWSSARWVAKSVSQSGMRSLAMWWASLSARGWAKEVRQQKTGERTPLGSRSYRSHSSVQCNPPRTRPSGSYRRTRDQHSSARRWPTSIPRHTTPRYMMHHMRLQRIQLHSARRCTGTPRWHLSRVRRTCHRHIRWHRMRHRIRHRMMSLCSMTRM
jgi:hypothetical protein